MICRLNDMYRKIKNKFKGNKKLYDKIYKSNQNVPSNLLKKKICGKL